MKKILVMILACLATLSVSAADFKYGVEAGVNLSIPTDCDVKPGFNVGVFGELGFKNNFYLESALKLALNPIQLSFNGDDVLPNVKDTYNPYSLQIPIRAGYKFNVSNNTKLFVAFGPYIGVGLWGKGSSKVNGNKVEDYNVSNVYNHENGLKRFEIGLSARVGVEFKEHFRFSVDYNRQLNNMSKNEFGISDYNQAVSFNIGYKF